jgi:hypothetical protein
LLRRLQLVFGLFLPQAIFSNPWSRMAALQNYAPAHYSGRVLLFRATDAPLLPVSDETMGWNEIVEGGVEVVFVPGDHETMFLEPNVQFFKPAFAPGTPVGRIRAQGCSGWEPYPGLICRVAPRSFARFILVKRILFVAKTGWLVKRHWLGSPWGPYPVVQPCLPLTIGPLFF